MRLLALSVYRLSGPDLINVIIPDNLVTYICSPDILNFIGDTHKVGGRVGGKGGWGCHFCYPTLHQWSSHVLHAWLFLL